MASIRLISTRIGKGSIAERVLSLGGNTCYCGVPSTSTTDRYPSHTSPSQQGMSFLRSNTLRPLPLSSSRRSFHSSSSLWTKSSSRPSASAKKFKQGTHPSKSNNRRSNAATPNIKGKKKNKDSPRPPRHLRSRIPDPVEQQRKQTPAKVPPAYLVRTASPYAYIAKCAIADELTGEFVVDPTCLYSELYNSTTNISSSSSGVPSKSSTQQQRQQQQRRRSMIPNVFKQSHLHYFPPSSFPNYEPPTNGTPEVAFLGRSNTGKSSLINALSSLILRGGGGASKHIGSGGGELARTSKRPGRTQTINYFGLIPNNAVDSSNSSSSLPFTSTSAKAGDKANKHPSINQSKLFLVDLPGFGYASAPDESVDAWQQRTQQFLVSRASTPEEVGKGGGIQPWPNANKSEGKRGTASNNNNNNNSRRIVSRDTSSPPLKRLYLLVDSRLPEPTLIDLSVMGWCDDYSIPYTIVLTKVDGSNRAHCVKLTNQLCMRYHSLLMDNGSHDEDEEEGLMDDTVYMDPVVYWTSSKDGLGMEELLLSVENNMFVAGEEEEEEGSGDDEAMFFDEDDDDESEDEEDAEIRMQKHE
eukprot:g13208.t1 g13208   contig8:159037-160785(-)